MKYGRFSLVLIAVLCGCCWTSPAAAGWFSNSREWEKSGLDLQGGYDRNTVTTLAGRISRLITENTDGPMLAEMQREGQVVLLILGPQQYWRTHGVSLAEGTEVTARGSQAVGKDGRNYLIVEKLTVADTEVRLRSETGRPTWAGGDRQRSMQIRTQFRGGRGGR